ncbi:hypothetical protein MX652_08875 [Thauera aromatica]|nr:hypothetical protein [Thauera aromatica]MCK2126801.1 hypothetical protein [Thauera aromatica]
MSSARARPARIGIDEYLDGETRTDIKREYLLVDPDQPCVELYRFGPPGRTSTCACSHLR